MMTKNPTILLARKFNQIPRLKSVIKTSFWVIWATPKILTQSEINSPQVTQIFFPSKSTLGMAKCFLNAKSENLLDDKKISFCRVITDLSRADPKKSLRSEFEQCLRSILGIDLETLEDFFEVDLEFKSVLADFESSGDLKNLLFKLKLCLRRGSLELFIQSKKRSTHTSHNM